jgi:integral membrane protein
VAHLEAVSWAGLIAGMLLEYVFVQHHDLGDRLVFAFGSVHGGLVLGYGALGATLAFTRRWGAREWTFGILASFVPFATVALDLWMARTGRYAD